MIPSFADRLRCPETGSTLRLVEGRTGPYGRVEHGALETADGGRRYPIVDFVPVFVESDSYATSFSRQWRRWSTERLDQRSSTEALKAHYERKFSVITGFGRDDLSGRAVVEFGAGSGLFAPPVRARGARYIGLDLNDAVVEAQAAFLGDPQVQFVRGDALSPPFAPDSADAAFSIGVFHHTPDPARAVRAMLETIAPGGRFAVSVYATDGYHGQRSIARLRAMYAALPEDERERFATGYAIVAAKLLHAVIGLHAQAPGRTEAMSRLQGALAPSFNDSNALWRAAVLYDAITPTYASTHTPEEVEGWLRDAGGALLERRGWPSIAFSGTRGQ